MVKYKTLQTELDEDIENKVLSIIKYYTIKEGGVDFDKVNPITFLRISYGITLADAQEAVLTLISENKIELA